MNIFAVDNDPTLAARDLPDKLCVKMNTESLQLLTPWLYNTYGIKVEKPDQKGQFALLESERKYYGIKGFAHHPCAKWLYLSSANVDWLLVHAIEICEEYARRYGKQHGSLYGLLEINKIHEAKHRPMTHWCDHTEFVQAMPEQYKDSDNPVQAYRNYLMGAKGYAEWRYCAPPAWWDVQKHQPVRDSYLAEKERKRSERKNAKHTPVSRGLQTQR